MKTPRCPHCPAANLDLYQERSLYGPIFVCALCGCIFNDELKALIHAAKCLLSGSQPVSHLT